MAAVPQVSVSRPDGADILVTLRLDSAFVLTMDEREEAFLGTLARDAAMRSLAAEE